MYRTPCKSTLCFRRKNPSAGFNFRFDIPDKSAHHQRELDAIKKKSTNRKRLLINKHIRMSSTPYISYCKKWWNLWLCYNFDYNALNIPLYIHLGYFKKNHKKSLNIRILYFMTYQEIRILLTQEKILTHFDDRWWCHCTF